MSPRRRFSLQQKLFLVIMSALITVLILSTVSLLLYQIRTYKKLMMTELESLSTILGDSNAAALRFEVAHSATASLASLRVRKQISSACMFTADNQLLAEYFRDGAPPEMPEPPFEPGFHFAGDKVTLISYVRHDADFIGTLHIAADLDWLHTQLRHSIPVTLGVFVVSCLIALLLSRRYLRIITAPLSGLQATAREVSESGNFSLRARKFSDDEMGRLTDSFNNMLEQISRRDSDLLQAHDQLQANVEELKAEKLELDRARQSEHELRERLNRSERMESLGHLAGGVAHDLNNILGPIVGYPDLILERLDADHPARDDMNQIKHSALRAAAVIQDLLTLGRRGNYQLVKLDLNTVVLSYLDSPPFIQFTNLHPNVVVNLDLASELPPVNGSAHHLTEVVMNLSLNAMEAMPNGGTLTIQTSEEHVEEPIDGYEIIDPGHYVMLTIGDTGIGIGRSDLPHVFEPFYTKKKMGRSGSGLGLAVVYGVIKDLDGLIDVVSEPGIGTQFLIYLPAMQGAPAAPEPDVQNTGGTERVLVVDDIEEQRTLATRILTSLGYQATAVPDGNSALATLQQDDFDIVLLDMILGDGKDGLDVYREIHRLYPYLQCVLASGFSETSRVKEALDLGARLYVQKPYTRKTLASALRSALDQPASARTA